MSTNMLEIDIWCRQDIFKRYIYTHIYRKCLKSITMVSNMLPNSKLWCTFGAFLYKSAPKVHPLWCTFLPWSQKHYKIGFWGPSGWLRDHMHDLMQFSATVGSNIFENCFIQGAEWNYSIGFAPIATHWCTSTCSCGRCSSQEEKDKKEA